MDRPVASNGVWTRQGDSSTPLESALEQYTTLQLNCFHPILPEMLPDERDSNGILLLSRAIYAEEIRFPSTGRESITTLRLRAYRKEGDAMLQYGLRLASGLDVTQDIQAALKQLKPVVFGQYHYLTRAYAASLACACCQFDPVSSMDTMSLSIIMANESAKLGLLSVSAFLCVYAVKGGTRQGLFEQVTDLYPALVAAYDAFTKSVGSQLGSRRQCAACGRRLKLRKKFKTCAGPCKELKKPVYCDRECQKADWQNHRQWCAAQEATVDELQLD